MARKPALQLATVRTSQAGEPANDLPETAAAANLAQGELGLATAALLPSLDAAGAVGNVQSQLAAALLRAYAAREASPAAAAGRVTSPAEAEMAAAVARLTRLAREQEGHVVRLQSLLEGLI